ncbi:flagellar type III secretion system pore protein FliP [Hyphomonas sp.]|uniref:flagellar type III secretion system pore protein FliP n=1 Tax=Hyphomonas sp. TaxID=87 RepID=UPI000B03A5F4|nr:flagellar type III secretion system pore protein FliP [Hyphomonas sp.]
MTRIQRAALLAACAALLAQAAFAGTPTAASPAAQGLLSGGVVNTALALTLLAIIPSILISMTSFIRIVIVLSMVRHAFGMPETPPNPVLISLAMFLTVFTMGPAFAEINQRAVEPLLAGTIDAPQAVEAAFGPLKTFMLSQVRDQDLQMIYEISRTPLPATPEEVDIWKLTPAFMLNELRIAFSIGFVIMLPFLLIDLVVASILLALGMMMVPPATISLPIKLLMFVLIDGWTLIVQGVLGGFG